MAIIEPVTERVDTLETCRNDESIVNQEMSKKTNHLRASFERQHQMCPVHWPSRQKTEEVQLDLDVFYLRCPSAIESIRMYQLNWARVGRQRCSQSTGNHGTSITALN